MTDRREETGFVDQRKRPIILSSIASPFISEPISTLDTGFTGDILVSQTHFDRIPCHRTLWYEDIETAGGTTHAFLAQTKIVWFGAERDVALFVTLTTTEIHKVDPIATIGTGLFVGRKLTIEFTEEVLKIE